MKVIKTVRSFTYLFFLLNSLFFSTNSQTKKSSEKQKGKQKEVVGQKVPMAEVRNAMLDPVR